MTFLEWERLRTAGEVAYLQALLCELHGEAQHAAFLRGQAFGTLLIRVFMVDEDEPELP